MPSSADAQPSADTINAVPVAAEALPSADTRTAEAQSSADTQSIADMTRTAAPFSVDTTPADTIRTDAPIWWMTTGSGSNLLGWWQCWPGTWQVLGTNNINLVLPQAQMTAASTSVLTYNVYSAPLSGFWGLWRDQRQLEQQAQQARPLPQSEEPPVLTEQEHSALWEEAARRDRESQERRRQREQAVVRRRREYAARMVVGEERARTLLLSCLNEEQRAELERDRVFHVTSREGRVFRIEPREVANLIEVDPCDRRIERSVWCVHPRDVPVYDIMLAQALWVATDVDGLLAVANRHR